MGELQQLPNRIQAQQLVQGSLTAQDSNNRTADVAGYRCCSLRKLN